MLTAVYKKGGMGRIFIKNFWRISQKKEEKGGEEDFVAKSEFYANLNSFIF